MEAINIEILLALLFVILFVGFLIRTSVLGEVRYARVDKQDEGILFRQNLMTAGYWSLQPLARVLISLKFSPNIISFIGLGLALGAGVFAASGDFGSAAILVCFSGVTDALDGMVARETGKVSKAGKVLDSCLDRYQEFCILAGLAIYFRESVFGLLLVLLAIHGAFMVSYSTAKADALQHRPPHGFMRRPERAFFLVLGLFISSLFYLAGWDTFRDWPLLISLGSIAILANVSAGLRIRNVMRTVDGNSKT